METIKEIVILFIPVLSIISISTALAILLKRLLTETVFPAITLVISVLFLFGLLNFKGCLLIGYSIIIIFAIISLIFSLKSFLSNKQLVKDTRAIQGLLLITLFLGISLFINYQRKYYLWDEFSYWGASVKSLYTFDALATYKESRIVVNSYIPGTPLLQYFFTRLFPKFIEYPSYVASNFMFFSLVIFFIKKDINIKNFFLIAGIILVPLIGYNDFYNSLYVDGILGVLFGCMILAHYSIDEREDLFFSLIFTICCSIVLTLTKQMGFLLALIGNLIIITDFLLFKKNSFHLFFKPAKKTKTLLLMLIFSPAVISIIIQLIWILHLHITNVFSPLDKTGNSILFLLQGKQFSSIEINIFHSFINAFRAQIIPAINLPYSKAILMISIIFIILLITSNKIGTSVKKRLFITYIGFLIGTFIYLCTLLYSYMFTFSNFEGIRLASYDRYVLSYLVGTSLYLFIFLLINKSESLINKKNLGNTWNNIKNIIYCITMFLIFNFLYENTKYPISLNIIHARESVSKTIEIRKPYDEILKWSKYITNSDKKTYILTQGDLGLNKLILMHTIYPSNTEWLTDYSVSLTPYYEDDPWTMIISPEDWQKYIIENYNFVYIFAYDDNFTKLYGQFFDNIKQYQLYSVNTDKNGNLQLISEQE